MENQSYIHLLRKERRSILGKKEKYEREDLFKKKRATRFLCQLSCRINVVTSEQPVPLDAGKPALMLVKTDTTINARTH